MGWKRQTWWNRVKFSSWNYDSPHVIHPLWCHPHRCAPLPHPPHLSACRAPAGRGGQGICTSDCSPLLWQCQRFQRIPTPPPPPSDPPPATDHAPWGQSRCSFHLFVPHHLSHVTLLRIVTVLVLALLRCHLCNTSPGISVFFIFSHFFLPSLFVFFNGDFGVALSMLSAYSSDSLCCSFLNYSVIWQWQYQCLSHTVSLSRHTWHASTVSHHRILSPSCCILCHTLCHHALWSQLFVSIELMSHLSPSLPWKPCHVLPLSLHTMMLWHISLLDLPFLWVLALVTLTRFDFVGVLSKLN